jgi:hypothetical protein
MDVEENGHGPLITFLLSGLCLERLRKIVFVGIPTEVHTDSLLDTRNLY